MGLLRKARELMPEGTRLEIADIHDIPFFNQDLEKPDSVKDLAAKAASADGFLLACPEYNYGMAPALKNVLDWLSREQAPTPLYGKPAAVIGAGGGMGTARSQNILRQVSVYLNLLLIDKPEFFSNAFSDAFAANGDLVDADLCKKLAALLESLAQWTRTLNKGRA